MGIYNSISKPKEIKERPEIDQNLISFIEYSLLGNFNEADKLLPLIQDEAFQQIVAVVKQLTWEKNHDQLLKLNAIQQSSDDVIDLAKWEKCQTVDNVFAHLKSQFSKVQHKNTLSIKEPISQLQAFLNVVWLGKYMLKAYTCIKSGKIAEFSPKLQGTMIPDLEVYDIVSGFTSLMVNFRSFLILKKIFDSQVAIQFLTYQHWKEQYSKLSFDRSFSESANQFRNDIVQILKNVKQVFVLWRQLYEQFLSRKDVIQLKGGQKEDFNHKVSRINELTKNKLSKKSSFRQPQPQMVMNGIIQKPNHNEIVILKKQIETLENKKLQLTQQLSIKDQQFKRNINQIQQKHAKQLKDKQRIIDELRRGKASAPSIEDIKAQLKDQYERKLKEAQKKFDKNQIENLSTISESLLKTKQEIYLLLNLRKTTQTTDFAKKQHKNRKQDITLEQLNKQIDRSFGDITRQLQIFTKRNQDSIDDLNAKNTQLDAQVKTLQTNIKIKQNQNDSLNQLNQSLEQQKRDLTAQNTTQKKKYEAIIADKDKEIKQKNQRIQDLEIQIKKLENKINELNSQLNQFQKQIKHTTVDYQSKIQSKQNDIKKLKRQIQNLNFDYTKKCQDIEKMTMYLKNQTRCYTQYFNGNILNIKQKDHLEWFVKNLQNCTQKQIKATYPLHRFDRYNKTSFHAYIDNKPQIVLVVRMTNGQIIAGYSEPPFKPKTNADFRTGFIFAFKNRKIFTVKKEATNKFNKTPPKPINYDEQYLSWGNSDIRIMSGSDELYSAYATANSSYEERGNNDSVVDDLLLQEERLTTLHDYELFQVEFEDGDNLW